MYKNDKCDRVIYIDMTDEKKMIGHGAKFFGIMPPKKCVFGKIEYFSQKNDSW